MLSGLHVDRELFHAITLNLLYASVVLLTFVILERLFYYAVMQVRMRGVIGAVDKGGTLPAHGDVLTQSIREYREAQAHGASRSRVEDLSADLFIRVDGHLNARLWILDTIVTAAPLLGLLGTILGIMDTFNALSAGGVSDPGAVSRGIGDALAATAIGIGTALYGLVGHNLLHRQAEHMSEAFKGVLLRATTV